MQTISYEILPKETKYAIAKRHGITVKERKSEPWNLKINLVLERR
jgi:hypothetical protein